MHDYHNHQNLILIIKSIAEEDLLENLGKNARLLCMDAIRQTNPESYLNQGFLLYGYFRF